jgi:hypothetical protein
MKLLLRIALAGLIASITSERATAQWFSSTAGDWSAPSTWFAGAIPPSGWDVVVRHDVEITMPGSFARILTLDTGASLTLTSGQLESGLNTSLVQHSIGSAFGAGTVVQTGGVWNLAGTDESLNVGGAGVGSYTISGGSLSGASANLRVGGFFFANAPGIFTVEGATPVLSFDNMQVGGTSGPATGELVVRPAGNGAMGLSTISLSGTLTLNANSVLTLEPQYPLQAGDSWTLVSAAAGITGTFGSVDLPSGITAMVDDAAGQLTLTITGVPVENDDCANAIALPSTFADTLFNAAGATTDGADATGFCDYSEFGDEQVYNDIWFTYRPDVGGCTYISTYGLVMYDTRLTIYDTPNCPDDPANIIACVDDEQIPTQFPYEAGLDVNLQAGVTYLIRLGTFDAATPAGAGTLRIAAGPGADLNSGGANAGAPGCVEFPSFCNGDGGDQAGCTDCPCGNNAIAGSVGGCAHSASAGNGGFGSRLLAEGSASLSLPAGATTDLALSMENMPPMSTAVMFSGSALAPQNMANPCFGTGTAVPLMNSGAKDGLRCAVGGLVRHGNRQSDMAGEIKGTMGPSRVWGGAAGPPEGLGVQAGFLAGQTRYFQATHRDLPAAQCMTGLNTSQAIEVTFTP